jgi:hypothetical protein
MNAVLAVPALALIGGEPAQAPTPLPRATTTDPGGMRTTMTDSSSATVR